MELPGLDKKKEKEAMEEIWMLRGEEIEVVGGDRGGCRRQGSGEV